MSQRPLDPGDPYDETEVVRRERRIEPEPVYEERPRVREEVYVDRAARPGWQLQAARAIYFIFGFIEAMILIRVLLRLLGANPNNGFASLVYNFTAPFLAPFRGLFYEEPSMGRQVLEFSSLIAILVYMLIAYGLVRLLYLLSSR